MKTTQHRFGDLTLKSADVTVADDTQRRYDTAANAATASDAASDLERVFVITVMRRRREAEGVDEFVVFGKEGVDNFLGGVSTDVLIQQMNDE